jgi:hypothetical protein
MEKLKRALLHLQKEKVPVEERLNDVSRGGRLYVKGLGRNLTTGLIHIFDSNKYGVWNNRSHKVLKHLKRPGVRLAYMHLWDLSVIHKKVGPILIAWRSKGNERRDTSLWI